MKDLKSADRYPSVPWINKNGELEWYPGETPDQETLDYFGKGNDQDDQAFTEVLP